MELNTAAWKGTEGRQLRSWEEKQLWEVVKGQVHYSCKLTGKGGFESNR